MFHHVCKQNPTLSRLLSCRLSFQIIDILLTHPVQRTTIEDRALLLELLQVCCT